MGRFISWPAGLLLRALDEPKEWKLEGWCGVSPMDGVVD